MRRNTNATADIKLPETNQKPTRTQEKTTSSLPNIPQHNPHHILQHIPHNTQQQTAFVGARQPLQLAKNQKATRKLPGSTQKATYSWPTIPQHTPPCLQEHTRQQTASVGSQQSQQSHFT
jgi:hypothetical protein